MLHELDTVKYGNHDDRRPFLLVCKNQVKTLEPGVNGTNAKGQF